MPTITLRGITDTYVTQASSKTKGYKSKTLYLRTQTNKDMFTYVQVSGIPAGATISSAVLELPLRSAWSGSTTVTTQRVTSSVASSKISYSKQPTTTTTGQVTQAVSGLSSSDVLTIDITAFAQLWASGTANYGVKISSTGTGLQKLRGSEYKGATAEKPRLVVTYEMAPAAPVALSPGGGQLASVARPVHTWRYSDVLSSPQAAYQYQANATNVFTAPTVDSGEVASASPQHTPTVDVLASYWWRVRVKNASGIWSEWSAPTQSGFTAKSALTITEPSGTTADSSPSAAWTFAGTQTAFQVIYRRGSVVLLDSGFQSGADTDWSSTQLLNYAAGPATVEVRVWDNVDRASTPGDPAYAVDTETYTYLPSNTVAGVYDLTVRTHGVMPVPIVAWKRDSLPDAVTIFRNDAPIAKVSGADLLVDGITSEFVDFTAPMLTDLVYRVVPSENNVDAEDQAEASHRVDRKYLWLLDPDDPDWYLALADRNELGIAYAETSEVINVRGSDRSILVYDSLRGYEGSVTGAVYDTLPGLEVTDARVLRDRVHHLKQFPTRVYRLVVDDLNIPVAVRNANVVRRAISATAFDVSAEVFQQGELPWVA